MTVNVVKMTFRGWLSALSGLFMQQELLLTRLAPWLIIANPGSIDSRVCQSSGDVRLLHVRFGGDVPHSGTADTKSRTRTSGICSPLSWPASPCRHRRWPA